MIRLPVTTGAPLTPAAPQAGPPMLDPSWTPQKGYAHALELLAILARRDRG